MKKDKIENIEKVFIVSKRSSKFVKPYRFGVEPFLCDVLAVFPNRKNAQEWVNFWDNGSEEFDVLERKLC